MEGFDDDFSPLQGSTAIPPEVSEEGQDVDALTTSDNKDGDDVPALRCKCSQIN